MFTSDGNAGGTMLDDRWATARLRPEPSEGGLFRVFLILFKVLRYRSRARAAKTRAPRAFETLGELRTRYHTYSSYGLTRNLLP